MVSGENSSLKRGGEMSRRYDDFVILSGLGITHADVEIALHRLFAGRGINWHIEKDPTGEIWIYVRFSKHRERIASYVWYSRLHRIASIAHSNIHSRDIKSLMNEV